MPVTNDHSIVRSRDLPVEVLMHGEAWARGHFAAMTRPDDELPEQLLVLATPHGLLRVPFSGELGAEETACRFIPTLIAAERASAAAHVSSVWVGWPIPGTDEPAAGRREAVQILGDDAIGRRWCLAADLRRSAGEPPLLASFEPVALGGGRYPEALRAALFHVAGKPADALCDCEVVGWLDSEVGRQFALGMSETIQDEAE
jgi:hypothetical protein